MKVSNFVDKPFLKSQFIDKPILKSQINDDDTGCTLSDA